jgi:hypothetical protein
MFRGSSLLIGVSSFGHCISFGLRLIGVPAIAKHLGLLIQLSRNPAIFSASKRRKTVKAVFFQISQSKTIKEKEDNMCAQGYCLLLL